MFSQKTLNPSQVEVLNTLFIVDEIFPGINKFVEKNDEGNLEISWGTMLKKNL